MAAVFAVYGQILGHDFIANWDDSAYVIDNRFVQEITWSNIRTIFSTYFVGNYAPVQMLSYMLDYAVWGAWAGGFLLTNLLVHTTNGLLFYRLLWRIHGDRLVAFIGSAVFLLHPVQVESVAWVSQRKNVLAMLFFLIAWEGYCRYRDAELGRGKLAYATAVTAFALALLSKSVAVILPVVLILYERCFLQKSERLHLKDKVPFILASAVVAVVALVSQQAELGGGRTGFHGGSPLATFYSMLPVLCRYLAMIVWPGGLSAEYDPTIYQSIDATVVAALFVIIVVAVACWKLLIHNRRLGFWALLFFVGLLPVSQVVPLVTLVNDRYLYFPMLGFAALSGVAGVSLLRKFETFFAVAAIRTLLAGILVLLAVTSWQRAKVWQDALSLWSDAFAKYPNKSSIQSAMGDVLLESGKVDEAWRAYERALKLNPHEINALLNLGILYSQQGNLEVGRHMLSEATMTDPSNFKGWANLGNNFILQGEYVEAEMAYLRALELQPTELKIVMLLGNVALLKHAPDRARNYYLQLEGIAGNDPEVACGLARADAMAGRADSAARWLEIALKRGFRDVDRLKGFGELKTVLQSPVYNDALRRYVPESALHRR